MKRWMMIATLGLAPLGCVSDNGDSPIRFLNALALSGAFGGTCTVDTAKAIGGGSLDLYGGSNYAMAMAVEVGSQVHLLDIESVPIASGIGLLDVNLTEVVYEYADVKGYSFPDEEVVPVSAVFRPTTSSNSYIFVNAFGPGALAELQAKVPSDGSQVTMRSTIYMRGRISSGSSVETSVFTFPVTVYRGSAQPTSATTCSITGYKPTGGVCNPGQDAQLCQPPLTAP